MVQTALIGLMLGGGWLVYLCCRFALTHFGWSFAGSESDRVALSFLCAMTYLLVLAALIWGQRQR